MVVSEHEATVNVRFFMPTLTPGLKSVCEKFAEKNLVAFASFLFKMHSNMMDPKETKKSSKKLTVFVSWVLANRN